MGFIKKFIDQAEIFQKKMLEMEVALKEAIHVGEAGGGAIKISMNGSGKVVNVQISDDLMIKEEKKILEDLICTACNEAKTKLEIDSQKIVSSMFGKDIPKDPYNWNY